MWAKCAIFLTQVSTKLCGTKTYFTVTDGISCLFIQIYPSNQTMYCSLVKECPWAEHLASLGIVNGALSIVSAFN